LTTEINFWSDRYIKLSDDKAAGKEIGPNLDNVRRTIADLESRLEAASANSNPCGTSHRLRRSF